MSLYHIEYDHESRWVEANNLQEAVSAWQKWAKEADALVDGDLEPESVHLVSDDRVIRAGENEGQKP